jgi:hypothetical protein
VFVRPVVRRGVLVLPTGAAHQASHPPVLRRAGARRVGWRLLKTGSVQ